MQGLLMISGFMGTGKSTVGRLVAERCGVRFIDLDDVVEQRAGRTISSLFRERGETEFRRLERQELRRLLDSGDPCVVALGGGALQDRALRIEVLGRAILVTLTADPEEIVRRVRAQDASGNSRPLLAGPDPRGAVLRLLASREAGYQECHVQVPTDDLTADQVASRVQEAWQEGGVAVAAGVDSYRVLIGQGLIAAKLARLLKQPSGALLVSDTTVAPLHAERARPTLAELSRHAEVLLTPGEQHKNLAGLQQIYAAAYETGLDRQATLVGLGGGVVTDMTGFAAATWVRGIRWIGLPTTLLSMVDASVGGKTGVDYEAAKNSVGAFWQPAGVICDVETLLTEQERMYRGALSEVIKTALIGDPALLDLLEQQADAVLERDLAVMAEIVDRSVRVKARIVALDEREAGLRATLNLGHTIGHALESAGGYAALTHGEAVSLGLVAALRLGQRLGRTPVELGERVVALLRRLGLPHQLEETALRDASQLIALDKKRAGDQVRFIFARDVGKVSGEALPLSDLVEQTPQLADA